MENLTDKELVIKTLENKDFFGELISRYEKKLTRYIRRITKVPETEKDDILQDVFIKVYINLNGFDTSLSFSSWIYRITYNVVVDSHRKRKTKTKYGFLDIHDDDIGKIGEKIKIEENFDHKIDSEIVQTVLRDLKQKDKDILVLKFLEGKSYEEIGDILKMPGGTIATRIHRAKKAFKKVYEEKYHD